MLVVDDHGAFSDAISLAIEVEDDLRCVGTVGTAEDALERIAESCPDVVLLDLAMPGMGGIEAIGALRAKCPTARILVLTATTTAQSIVAAIDAGADGFLPKEASFRSVLEAVRSDEALTLDSTTIADVLRAATRDGTAVGRAPVDHLTDREYTVLLLLADGLAAKQIARQLDISVHTARGHVSSVLFKLDAHTQLEAVVRAARMGILPGWGTGDP